MNLVSFSGIFFCIQFYVLRGRRQYIKSNNTHTVGDGNLSILWHSMKTLVKNLRILKKHDFLMFGLLEKWTLLTEVKFQTFIYTYKMVLATGSL